MKKPIPVLIQMMLSEVPIACFMEIFNNLTMVGINTNPPPAPNTPVMSPTIKPDIIILRLLGNSLIGSTFLDRIILMDDQIMTKLNKNKIRRLLVNAQSPIEKRTFGIIGNKKVLLAYTLSKDGIPNINNAIGYKTIHLTS